MKISEKDRINLIKILEFDFDSVNMRIDKIEKQIEIILAAVKQMGSKNRKDG